MERLDFFTCDEDYKIYLKEVTGYPYAFKISAARTFEESFEQGVFYRLQPEQKDDGFYEWYRFKMPNRQYFRTKTEAVLLFTRMWFEWNKTQEWVY